MFGLGGVGGVGGEWLTGLGWSLPILEEHGKVGYVRVLVVVVLGSVGGWLGPGSGRVCVC